MLISPSFPDGAQTWVLLQAILKVTAILSPLRVTVLLALLLGKMWISSPTPSHCFRGKCLYFQYKLVQMVSSITSCCLGAVESFVEASAVLRSTQSCWTLIVLNFVIWQRCLLSNVITFWKICIFCAGKGRPQVLLRMEEK